MGLDIKAILDDIYLYKHTNEEEITKLINKEQEPINDSKDGYEYRGETRGELKGLKQAKKLLDFSIISIIKNIQK